MYINLTGVLLFSVFVYVAKLCFNALVMLFSEAFMSIRHL